MPLVLQTSLEATLRHEPLAAVPVLFAAGLATSLTPCVFPMIPITAGILGGAGASGISRGRTAGLTVAYVSGLALAYALLGLLAGVSGSLFGSVASSPWAYFVTGNLLLVLGLALLDVFTVNPPRKVATWAARLGSSSPGGAFTMGAASGLVAAPSRRPPAGSRALITPLSRGSPSMRLHTLGLVGCLLAAHVSGLDAQAADGSATAVIVGGPREGARAPEFSLPWANREAVGPSESPYQLWRDRGKTVVVAFYPRDFAKGCTAQLQTFADQYDTLFGPDVVVLAVNADSLETHRRFAASLDLPFRLLSDPDQQVSRKYGSSGKSGRPRRTVFVVGPDGRVKYRNLHFNALDPRHYTELGSAVRAARGG